MKSVRIYRLLAIVLILSCLLGTVPAYAAETEAWPEEPETAAEPLENEALSDFYLYCDGVSLMDRNTGRILYQMNGDGLIYPASTTKIMTALLCAKYGNMDDYVTIYSSDYDNLWGEDPSLAGFQPGWTLSVRSLMKGMLVVSGCDAADVIARYIGGTIPNFVEMMNQEARALGCTGTHFASPHGLPDYNHYTTANDMARIASAAMAYPEIRAIVGSSSAYIPELNWTMYNTNGLLPYSGSGYGYEYCIGVKTGTTSQAGACLVSAAAKDGVELVCAIYGAPDISSRYYQSEQLLRWGFTQDFSRSIADAQIRLEQESYIYDGNEKRPAVTVTLEGAALTPGTDYTVEYRANVQAGQAGVLVTGAGNYYGQVTKAFTIRSPLPFADVPTDSWAFPVIRTAYEQHLINGRAADAFEPEAPVTRAEAVTLLHRFLGSPEPVGGTTFTDLENVEYAIPAICWGQNSGVLQGRTETEFDPDAPVTRQELAAMMFRTGSYGASADMEDRFVDRDQISDYAVEAVAWSVREGLLSGRQEIDGLWLAPESDATRAEVTALMLRFKTWYEEHTSVTVSQAA